QPSPHIRATPARCECCVGRRAGWAQALVEGCLPPSATDDLARRATFMTTPRGPQPFAGQEKRLRLLAFVRQDSIVRVDKRVEDTAMVWPHLLVIEFIAAMLWSIGLFVIAAAFNAPLQDHGNPDCTP